MTMARNRRSITVSSALLIERLKALAGERCAPRVRLRGHHGSYDRFILDKCLFRLQPDLPGGVMLLLMDDVVDHFPLMTRAHAECAVVALPAKRVPRNQRFV